MRNEKIAFLTRAGLIAAAYVVLTMLFRPFCFGEIQVRVSEMLVILPALTPAAIPGVFVGCLVANILGGAMVPDIVFGSLATLAGAVLTRKLRNRGLLIAALPPIVANALVIPFVLRYAYAVPMPLWLMALSVGAGEVISVGILGVALGKFVEKNSAVSNLIK